MNSRLVPATGVFYTLCRAIYGYVVANPFFSPETVSLAKYQRGKQTRVERLNGILTGITHARYRLK